MITNMLKSSVDTFDNKVIQATGLVRRFGQFTAVDDVDITLQRGEVFGLLGANGAGKTTTIRMLCGTLPPSAGRIAISGIDMVHDARHARSRIGYVSQRFALYGDLQVMENLNLQAGLYNVNSKRKAERIQWALEHLSLTEYQNVLAKELPLGYKRRLAFAAALLHEPEVLFLDEPTSGVDPAARQHFWELIYDLADADTPQNLQQTSLKTTLLELDAPDCKQCIPLVKKLPQVQEVIPHAGALRLRLRAGSNADEVMQLIKDLAREHHQVISKFQVTQAELEDVFIAMLEDVSGEKPS
ncbi:MAG: ABC transporter ATP-binding protein [Gammaproteobacteria bacterium]